MIDGQLMNDVLAVLLVTAMCYGSAVLSYSYGASDAGKREIDRWLKLMHDIEDGVPHIEAITTAVDDCVASDRALRLFTLSPWRSSMVRSERGQTGDPK